jgi:membrane protease YdiL (CAAX protease family)
MRRGISIALILDVIWLIGTGVLQLLSPFNEEVDPNHIIPVVIFIILLSIHLWLNRKPICKYFTGLGWKWVYIALGIILVLWGVVGVPLMMVN